MNIGVKNRSAFQMAEALTSAFVTLRGVKDSPLPKINVVSNVNELSDQSYHNNSMEENDVLRHHLDSLYVT